MKTRKTLESGVINQKRNRFCEIFYGCAVGRKRIQKSQQITLGDDFLNLKQISGFVPVDDNTSQCFGSDLYSSTKPIYCEENLENMKKNLSPIFQSSFQIFAIFLSCFGFGQIGQACADESYDLVHRVTDNETLNIRSQVQYLGSVIVDREDQQHTLPLDVRARFDFDQRISSSSKVHPQAIRYFQSAEASIKAGKGRTASKLNKENKLVLARMKDLSDGGHDYQIAAIGGMLSQKEYELLKNPGDPLVYGDLFRQTDVAIGEQWKLEKSQLIGLLALNRIITNSVSMKLKSVQDNIAKIYIFGNVKGEVDDAITNMKVKGIARLDLEKELVVGLRMSIDEERRVGQLAPGFEGQVKLDFQIQPTAENIMMSKSQLAKAAKGKKIKFSFMLDREGSDFQLIHNNKWRVVATEDEAAILRYVHDGQMIAQCNVVELPKRPADTPLKLSEFQDEVSKIIKESEARIIDSEKFATASGYDALKVEVSGRESGIPFNWLYYHVEGDDGRRITFVFTMEKEFADYLGIADQNLVKGVTFKTPRQAKTNELKSATR